MTVLEAHIEEFEQGSWVADLVLKEAFAGTFKLPDGSLWIGTKVTEIQDKGRYFTKVVGGKNKLGAVVPDQFYQGSTSLQLAVQSLCGQIGETPGTVQAGVFLTQFQQLIGIGSEALDAMAKAAGGAVLAGSDPMLWWIGRDGLLQMRSPDLVYKGRPPAGLVKGTRDMETVDVDGSVELLVPQGAVLGALYGTPPLAVRHIRWKVTPDRFSARLYFVPFIFRPPTQRKYDATYNAKVIADNGDGTVDVYVYRSPSDGKSPAFGVKKVPLFCGVPHAKVKLDPGDEVSFGWFGGDPQKPYAMSMKQDTSATKKVARNGDTVQVTITAAQLTLLALEFVSPVGPCVYTPGGSPPPTPPGAPGLDVTGNITSGSERLKVGD